MPNFQLALSVANYPRIQVTMPMDYTTTRAFDDAEKLTLTRAWASTASLKSLVGRPGVFWDKVRTNYSLNAQVRTAEELLAQWQTMVQSMDEFLKLFQQKYFQFRQNLRSDLACVGLSYKWAAAEYNAKTGKAFREVNAASLLTNHRKWWTVLNPLVNLQQDAIVEGGLTIATHTFPQAASGTVHLRGEDGGNQELDRRVRQRLNVESPILQGSKTEILLSPLGSTIATAETKSIALGTSGNAKVVVMERRLDLEIVTQSQEGLSDDAVEYLRWQRRLVLAKMRQ
ncbi:hypothetical protein GQ600_19970 [Phytophthora cactorum]|nr:hypothetical protein GQ600_19970 [Phytophthora cactorum]